MSGLRRIVDFLFEAGMLKRTPRTGFQFLGHGDESVAEHIFRTACIGYVLGALSPQVDRHRLLMMCLLHDILEARTGDLNYVNKKYVKVDTERAVREHTEGLPFGEELQGLLREYEAQESPEAQLAWDADQLELLLALKEQKDLGSPYAEEWLQYALRRLKTPLGKKLAQEALSTDSSLWWFSQKDDWWVWGK
jgi:putative hydrolase of HD superfamily